eukprot:TRINITY_DN7646_c0_g1_i4.p3 TRINITY_DN7646_c0_g1~~TRINITY_DN7646_c0_g1_i4.p3  ORF type:complete len:206 (-),score=-8.12 TRINITY_DN7646_c0_g1_i4:127-744(-)
MDFRIEQQYIDLWLIKYCNQRMLSVWGKKNNTQNDCNNKYVAIVVFLIEYQYIVQYNIQYVIVHSDSSWWWSLKSSVIMIIICLLSFFNFQKVDIESNCQCEVQQTVAKIQCQFIYLINGRISVYCCYCYQKKMLQLLLIKQYQLQWDCISTFFRLLHPSVLKCLKRWNIRILGYFIFFLICQNEWLQMNGLRNKMYDQCNWNML